MSEKITLTTSFTTQEFEEIISDDEELIGIEKIEKDGIKLYDKTLSPIKTKFKDKEVVFHCMVPYDDYFEAIGAILYKIDFEVNKKLLEKSSRDNYNFKDLEGDNNISFDQILKIELVLVSKTDNGIGPNPVATIYEKK